MSYKSLFQSFYLIIILGIISLTACSSQSKIPNYPDHYNSKPAIVKTIYIDKEIVMRGKDVDIIMAIRNWECSTHYYFRANIVLNFDETMDSKIDPETSVVILHSLHTNALIVATDKELIKDNLITIGLYVPTGYQDHNNYPHILLVDDRIRDNSYESVAAHELGHSLSMDHLNQETAVMFKSISDYKPLTNYDLDEFCSKNKCPEADRKNMSVCW